MLRSEAPNGTVGDWSVSSFMLLPTQCAITNKHRRLAGLTGTISPGEFKQLAVNGFVITADTGVEEALTLPFVEQAQGDVFINGLGLGMMLRPLLDSPEVTSVTVLEKVSEIIELVAPAYAHPKLTVLCGDALAFTPTRQYTCAWHDIWARIDQKALEERALLEAKWASFVDWQMSREKA